MHAFEQEALHWLFLKKHPIRAYSSHLVEVLQFLPCDNHIFCHGNGHAINAMLDKSLAMLNIISEDDFKKVVDGIKLKSSCSAPLFPITQAMLPGNTMIAIEGLMSNTNALIHKCQSLAK